MLTLKIYNLIFHLESDIYLKCLTEVKWFSQLWHIYMMDYLQLFKRVSTKHIIVIYLLRYKQTGYKTLHGIMHQQKTTKRLDGTRYQIIIEQQGGTLGNFFPFLYSPTTNILSLINEIYYLQSHKYVFFSERNIFTVINMKAL